MTVTMTAVFEIGETDLPKSKIVEIFKHCALPDYGVFIMEGENEDGEMEEDFYQIQINTSEVTKIKIIQDAN